MTDSWFKRGWDFTWGATAFISVMYFIVWMTLGLTGWAMDDSDKSAWHRSGLEIVTDAKTGKQYLVTFSGGIIARDQK